MRKVCENKKNPINKNLAECNCYTIEFAGMTQRTRKKTGEGGFMRDVDVIAHLMKIQGWMMRTGCKDDMTHRLKRRS